jgi:hypothetical protein
MRNDVRLSFSARVRIGTASRAPRSITVIIVAILFQAILFAWHHHAPSFSLLGAPSVAALAAGGPETPAADHDCEICFALAHYGAVAVDLFAAAPPEQTPLPQIRVATAVVSLTAYFLFRSRAPPRA